MKKKVINSQLSNYATYQMYKRQMLNLAQNVFEFKNLPEFIDVAYINATLLQQGSIAFFEDEVMGVIALPYSVIGKLDIYGRPQQIMARAYNGTYFRKLNKDEFVIMYDNTGFYSIYLDICQQAERIAQAKRTIDINLTHQRTPRIVKTSKDKELSVKKILEEFDSMCDKIVTYDAIDIDDIDVILAPAPFVADKVRQELEREFAEFYRLIGIANLQEQKKERVIVDEILTSQGGTIASRYSRYEPRKHAIELINKKFGTNIEVRYYDGEPSMYSEDNEESEAF